jgi:SHS2 domain-containing protein
MPESFRTFDHTGDLGLIVEAETPARLHALAAEALLAQVAVGDAAPPDVDVTLALDGDDAHDLFIHWLNSALLAADVRHAVWTRVTVSALTRQRIEARLEGQRLDPKRHVFLREVKAVSHHHLELELTPPLCRCRIVLDL